MCRPLLKVLIAAYCTCLLATALAQADEKWSRQLDSTDSVQADNFDWVPLSQADDNGATSKDRSENGRALAYTQAFPPNGRFGEFAKSQHTAFDFPYQFQRFPNVPPAPGAHLPQPLKGASLQSQEPTSQSFFKFEMPFNGEDHRTSSVGAPSSLQTGYQIQHTFGGGAQATVFNSPLFNQNPVFPPDFHPLPAKPQAQPLQTKPLHQQNYIQDSYPLKSHFRESKPVQSLQESLKTVTPQVFPASNQPESLLGLNKPSSFQAQSPFQETAPSTAPSAPNNGVQQPQQQEVQLLYVPYDTLFNQQQQQRPQGLLTAQNPSFELNKYNINTGLPAVNPYQINQFYTPEPFPQQDFKYYTTSTTNRPHSPPTIATSTYRPVFQGFHTEPVTTHKPKPKAHQPPLAMFIVRNTARPTKSDVVATLRNANTIAVVDAPTQHVPEIFVGPAGMPIPNGYAKFELPYLSQLSQPPRDLHDVSFFVAPLSYRTPNGFNKILLPEPHVGSIVINRAKDNVAQHQQPQQNTAISPGPHGVIHYQNSTPRSRPNTPLYKGQRTQHTSPPRDYYSDDYLRVPSQSQKSQSPFDFTTERSVTPARGNKFSYFYNQDAIQEVSSPKIAKHDRPKKKRPHHTVQAQQPAFSQNINNPYVQFKQVPNEFPNDDFFKIETTRAPTSTTTSTSATTSTTTSPSATFYNYNTNPIVGIHSTNSQLYHDFTSAPNEAEEYVPTYTTRAPSVTTAEEEYRMKHYFRQQDAFRNRPQIVSSTNSPFELVNYTPVSLDFDQAATTQPPTIPKHRFTLYTPTAPPTTIPEEAANTVPTRTDSNREEVAHTENPSENNLPNNHRLAYNKNEIHDGAVEYEPNPYQLPSELPPLTANLPGLVNGLQEKGKELVRHQPGSTPAYRQDEETTPPSPTRRPLNRTRKPVVAKVSSSVSYSESESSSRRPSHRTRRPYGSRTNSSKLANDTDTGEEEPIVKPTRRPTSARNPLVRNPNRIRYQPTPEERQTLRIKPRKKYNSAGKAQQSEDIDYQRDVLKQNYPVLRPVGSARRPTNPTANPSSYSAVTLTTDRAISESQQVYTVTPNSNVGNDEKEQTFPAGLLEPMQIAQQYKQYSEENYGPGYFPNQEDLSPTDPSIRNEVHPVYTTIQITTPTTTTTTTTEEPQLVTTTKRSLFVRRNYPRLRPTTTTEAPTTVTATVEQRQTARPRIPPRKVIKVRSRTRRPHPASSTSAPQDEGDEQQEPEAKNTYRKLNRFNQDLYENESPRNRFKPTQFQLDGQESQWSPSIKSKNNFKPLNPREEKKKTTHNYENEPEIVTAGAEHGQNNEENHDTYEVNVSADLGSSRMESKLNTLQPNLKPEKSFAELLEEVMGKSTGAPTTESDLATRTTDGTLFDSQKTAISNRLNRRGKWKKLRVTGSNTATNKESFETAESQSLGSQLLNSLYDGEKKATVSASGDELKPSTPKTPTTTIAQDFTTLLTATPADATTSQTSIDDNSNLMTTTAFESTTLTSMLQAPSDEEMEEIKLATTTSSETTDEIATRRLDEQEDPLTAEDDLETQPSLFSEVKRQLHELFSIEENDDHAVDSALAAVSKRRQEYTNIKRTKPEPTTTEALQNTLETTLSPPSQASGDETSNDKKAFHKDLMEHVVYATATSIKVSSETEICYRGRCIRSEDLPPNHKLN